MGRIDEAIRRSTHQQGGAPSSTHDTDLFQPAWSVAETDVVAAEPVTVAERSARLAVVPAPTPSLERERTAESAPLSRLLLVEETSPALRALSAQWKDRLVVSTEVNPVLVEQFRRLAAQLFQAQSSGQLKVVMVTSASPGDGKTLTAVNLALTLSESYRRRVLLVDTDLRRPSISNISHIAPKVGLSDSLKSDVEQKLSVFQLTSTLTLLPAGRPDPDPMSGLTSPRMRQILDEAASRFDWVILDAPPVGPVADANLLAAMADAVLLVVRAGVTRHADVQKTVEALGRERIFGVVLNATEEAANEQYDRQYAAYQGKGVSV